MSSRRTTADLREGVRALLHQPGGRAPSSLAEASAAAHINGQLRQFGLRVSADTFRLPMPSTMGALLPGIVGLLVAGSMAPLPLPSLLLALWALVTTGLLPLFGAPPLLARWAESQNVVGVRAATVLRQWRVVLLARLDSAAPLVGIARLAFGRLAAVGRASAFAALAALAALVWVNGPLPWAPLAALPAAYLLVVSLASLRRPPPPNESDGAGALAVLLAASAELAGLREVELWAIALGAADTGGAATLYERYPFERESTLLLALDGLDTGRLTVLTPLGGAFERPVAPLLSALASAHAAEPEIGATVELGALPEAAALAHARGLRVVALSGAGASPPAPPDDQFPGIDGQLVERATRLVAAMVRDLDEVVKT